MKDITTLNFIDMFQLVAWDLMHVGHGEYNMDLFGASNDLKGHKGVS